MAEKQNDIWANKVNELRLAKILAMIDLYYEAMEPIQLVDDDWEIIKRACQKELAAIVNKQTVEGLSNGATNV